MISRVKLRSVLKLKYIVVYLAYILVIFTHLYKFQIYIPRGAKNEEHADLVKLEIIKFGDAEGKASLAHNDELPYLYPNQCFKNSP